MENLSADNIAVKVQFEILRDKADNLCVAANNVVSAIIPLMHIIDPAVIATIDELGIALRALQEELQNKL